VLFHYCLASGTGVLQSTPHRFQVRKASYKEKKKKDKIKQMKPKACNEGYQGTSGKKRLNSGRRD